MRNYAGFALREKGKFISPQVTFGSSDTTAYTSAPSLYGHIPDIRLGSDPYRSMSDWPDRISKKSPSYSISQDTGEGITAHEMYHVARGVSSMSPLLDAALSPAIYKSSGDYSSAKPSDVITVSKEIYQVDDIEEVAKIYEGKGYAVSEAYFGNPLYIRNRIFYDVLQCDDVLIGDINSEEVIDDIKGRLANGLRLWHQSDSDLTKLACEAYYVQFGQLFLKDNTEV